MENLPWVSNGEPTMGVQWKTYHGCLMENLPWVSNGKPTMVVKRKTYHGSLVAKCLLKAEVASMGDKPLKVGVGQKVLRNICLKMFKTHMQEILTKDLSGNILNYLYTC